MSNSESPITKLNETEMQNDPSMSIDDSFAPPSCKPSKSSSESIDVSINPLKTPLIKQLHLDDLEASSFTIPATPISATKIPFSRVSTPTSLMKSYLTRSSCKARRIISPQHFSPLLLSNQNSPLSPQQKQKILINEEDNNITIYNDDSNPPLLTNKPTIHFGSVLINDKETSSILLKNNRKEEITLNLDIIDDKNEYSSKNGYKLQCDSVITLKSSEVKEIFVEFNPTTQNQYVSILNIEVKLLSEKKDGEDIIKNKLLYKYMIPLNGFGGKCDINCFVYNDPMILELNSNGTDYENIILLKNTGTRSGVIFTMLDDPENMIHEEIKKSIEISPKNFILHSGDEININISINKEIYEKYCNSNKNNNRIGDDGEEEDNDGVKFTVLIGWNEEINRMKTYYNMKDSSELLKLMKSNYVIESDITEDELKYINIESEKMVMDLRILNEEENKNTIKILKLNKLNRIFEYFHYNESMNSIFIDCEIPSINNNDIKSDKIDNVINKLEKIEGTEVESLNNINNNEDKENKDSNHINKREGVFFNDTYIVFPSCHLGETVTRNVKLCNRSPNKVTVQLHQLQLPYLLPKIKYHLKPYTYTRVLIYFSPRIESDIGKNIVHLKGTVTSSVKVEEIELNLKQN